MESLGPPPIELRGVAKRYGKQVVLEAADLAVARGEFVVIIGRSGSGKSTLLRLIGGLEPPDAGRVLLGGENLGALTERQRAELRRRRLGFVFQFFNLIPTLTVSENVQLPLALNDIPKLEAERRAAELLRELGILQCAERFPEEISGGEQQRVAIARAVAHEPEVVLADEPTGDLDLDTARRVLELLETTCRRRGATLVMATHGREVIGMADRVLAIFDGRVVDTPQ